MSKVENYKLYFTVSSPDYFQQHVIKLFQKWGKLPIENLVALYIVYGDDVMPKSFYEWYSLQIEERNVLMGLAPVECLNVQHYLYWGSRTRISW